MDVRAILAIDEQMVDVFEAEIRPRLIGVEADFVFPLRDEHGPSWTRDGRCGGDGLPDGGAVVRDAVAGRPELHDV